jgi:hypothetical protein
MDGAQTAATCREAEQATVVATHMEALDHATVDRIGLRAFADGKKIPESRLLIPADGEVIASPRR